MADIGTLIHFSKCPNPSPIPASSQAVSKLTSVKQHWTNNGVTDSTFQGKPDVAMKLQLYETGKGQMRWVFPSTKTQLLRYWKPDDYFQTFSTERECKRISLSVLEKQFAFGRSKVHSIYGNFSGQRSKAAWTTWGSSPNIEIVKTLSHQLWDLVEVPHYSSKHHQRPCEVDHP